MISDENKKFLKEKFNIDSDLYTQEELEKLVKKIKIMLDDSIKEKEYNILKLKQEIFLMENEES